MEKQDNSIILNISNALTKLINGVKKNGVLISTWCVMLFIITYSFIINPFNVNEIVKELNLKQQTEHTESINRRLIADDMIPVILDNIRIKQGVDRVCILELHNNSTNINNVSFLYFSLSYERFDFKNDSINYIGDFYQHQRSSEYSEIFKEMKIRGYAYYSNLSQKDYGIPVLRKISNNGTNSLLLIPIYNNENQINVILALSSKQDNFNINNITVDLYPQLVKIKELLL